MRIKINQPHDDYFYKKVRSIEEILIWATTNDCSDVYIKVSDKPYVSRYGKVKQLECVETTKEDWQDFYNKYVLNELNAQYVRQKMLDISVEIQVPEDNKYFGEYTYFKYRASFGFSEDKNICTFRMIRPHKPMFDTINYPKQCETALRKAFERDNGIIFFTGATGSGKSTTLAACINTFSKDIIDNKVLITLEDPIENVFDSTSSIKINQKELGVDFKSYASGVKQALREHPDIIVVGECRDKEVISTAIEAARTGHRTITSFHASDVPGTISRLSYHLDNDVNLVYDLICNLTIVMSQKLVPSDDGYFVNTQYLLFDEKVTKRVLSIIDTGKNIAVEVAKLFDDEDLIKEGLLKNWD